MAILKVARMGHPVLRQKAAPVPEEEIRREAFRRLCRDMVETMFEYEGVGLAGPQVHESKRVIVVRAPADEEGAGGEPEVLVNPAFEPVGQGRGSGWEGCLSIPEIRGLVPRYTRIAVTAATPGGERCAFEAADFHARVIQHEVDHLDGVLYPDRMESLASLTFLEEYSRFWMEDGQGEAENAAG